MEVIGYLGAVLMGIVLGLIGGGGSILTVPIFVYLLGFDAVMATAYSLFVVGISSLIGALRNIPLKTIDVKTALIFAPPALVAVFLTRMYLIPAIPDVLFNISSFQVTKDIAIMLFFALVMLLAAISMIRSKKAPEEQLDIPQKYNFPMIILEGSVVGLLTGIVGAGGGFLIIPALVLFGKLPMKKAVGTSLLIIAIKSLFGFIGDVQHSDIDWIFLLSFSGFSILGILIGVYLNNYIDGKKLKKAFGYFVLLMAIYIILKELFL